MVYVIPQENVFNVNIKPKYVKESRENIVNSLKFFVICSQFLGILPVENITVPNKLRFRWKSWKVLHTLFFIGMTTVASTLCLLDWFYVGYVFNSLGITIFYSSALVTLILYVNLARSWPKLMTLWCRIDKIMNNSYGYPKSLNRRFRIVSATYSILALGNFLINTVYKSISIKESTRNEYNINKYYFKSFPQMFRFIPFSAVSATFCCIVHIHTLLTWLINDLFIILISIALALRFKQISERLVRNQRTFQNKSLHFWKEIREDYDRLSLLCKELDKHLSYMILLSFSMNIFFLLVKLYNSLEGFADVSGQVYFVYSFVYLIIKIVSVSLYAAWINDESVGPASILNSVPASSYNIEIRRLLTQINFDNVALTGCRMFKVTRGIILSIAGAVVTYELVLIQFNAATGLDTTE
uniref:Gustatory receptor n=2 Tax=Anoplophora chinensis TaxID=217632 RepID=A0A2H4ZBC9_ANOCN|nr:gustatory receptor [Anoplophora chinensis]